MQMSYSYGIGLAFQKPLQTRQTSRNNKTILQERILVMTNHFLGNSKLNSIPEWRVFYLKSKAYNNLREQILFIQIAKLKKFSTLKNSRFPLTHSMKVHRRALVLLPCLIPYLRCENSQLSSFLIMQRDNIHARAHDTCVDIWRQDGAICSKNRKIVPYHGSART